MNETADPELNHRAAIARRVQRRQSADRDRKLSMAAVGLAGYSAFGNLSGGIAAWSFSPIDAGIALVLGGLYAFAAWRIWFKDDVRWWPVALPGGISLALIVLMRVDGVPLPPIPLAINLVLLALIPLRVRAAARLAADRAPAHAWPLPTATPDPDAPAGFAGDQDRPTHP